MEEWLNSANANPTPSAPAKRKGRPPKKQIDPPPTNDDVDSVLPTEKEGDVDRDGAELATDEPKKRGRKKKEKVPEEEPRIKKKRGRKAALKFFSSSIRKKIPIKTDLHDNDNLILHLDVDESQKADEQPIRSERVVSGDDAGNVSHFQELISNIEDDDFDVVEEYLRKKENDESGESLDSLKELYEKKLKQRGVQDKDILNKLERITEHEHLQLQMQLESLHVGASGRDASSDGEDEEQLRTNTSRRGFLVKLKDFVENDEHWIDKTGISCWWCCHEFDTVPWGMPLRYKDTIKKFSVTGCFCSAACMLAWYYSSKYKAKLEVYSLIKHMYTKLTGASLQDKITPAPPRECLRKFGGELSIDEFRNATHNMKAYKMIEYPMIVIKEFIEEIDLNNLKVQNKRLQKTFQNKDFTLKENTIEQAKLRLSQLDKHEACNTMDKFLKLR